MRKKLVPLIACPICKGNLEYRRGNSDLVCEKDAISFPVRDGIAVLLEMDAIKSGDKNFAKNDD